MPYEGPKAYRRDELTYNRYLQVEQMLQLQIPQSDPPHHDETLFIIIHQSYELWFKQILHEMESAIKAMHKGRALRAFRRLDRMTKIMRLLVDQIHILETMAPAEFLQFRDRLNPASGFQSIQFREIEYMSGLREERYINVFTNWPEYQAILRKRWNGPNLRSAFYALLRAHDYDVPEGMTRPDHEATETEKEQTIEALKTLYLYPNRNLRIYLLSEALIEFDEFLVLWRTHHHLTVERVIGGRKGTGGSAGVKYLESTTSKRCFPLLWEVRTHLTKAPEWEED
jgi:tryptophan 2,3-dioxygenase